MTTVQASAEQVVRGIFIDTEDHTNNLRVVCNWCTGDTVSFYSGVDVSLPETNWLAEIIEHLVATHPDRLGS